MDKKILVIGILGMFLLTSLVGVSAFSTKTVIQNFNIPLNGEWSNTFGGEGNEDIMCCKQTNDGGYISIGGMEKIYSTDVWLIKVDSDGNKIWDKTFGGDLDDAGFSVQQTTDGGYILTGFSDLDDSQAFVWLIKTDENGNVIWDKKFGERSFFSVGVSVYQTDDGGYIINAGKESILGFSIRVWLIKTDYNGVIEWDRTFEGSVSPFSSFQQTSDGGYIVGGLTDSLFPDGYLLKIDSFGNPQWEKIFDKVVIMSLQQTDDKGYILAGGAYDYQNENEDILLIKTDNLGNLIWKKTYGGGASEAAHCVIQTNDNGYIASGYTSSFGAGDNDFYLVKTDENGNKLWHKTFGGAEFDMAFSIEPTADGKYIIAGETRSYGAGEFDAWLIKTSDFENARPGPITISGPTNGKAGESIEYMFTSSVDPDSDVVYLWIDWGDGNIEKDNWFGPFSSGETIKISHTWSKKGTYDIKAKTMDSYGGESDWATLKVSMPRNKMIQNLFFVKLLEHLPILARLLNCFG